MQLFDSTREQALHWVGLCLDNLPVFTYSIAIPLEEGSASLPRACYGWNLGVRRAGDQEGKVLIERGQPQKE